MTECDIKFLKYCGYDDSQIEHIDDVWDYKKEESYKMWKEGFDEATKELQEANLKLEAKVRTLEIEQNYCLPNCSKIADLENKLSNVSYQLEGREVELKELKDKCSSLLDKLYLSGLSQKQIAFVEQLQDVLGV